MTDSRSPQAVIEALSHIEGDLQRFGSQASESMARTDREITRLEQQLERRQTELERELADCQTALAECLNSSYVDAHGVPYYPDCTSYEREIKKLGEYLENLARLRSMVDQIVRRYRPAASHFRATIDREIPASTYWLRAREESLAKFEHGHGESLPGGITSTLAPTLIGMLANLGGGHGTRYQKARQEYLRSVVDDPNQPNYVRGWVKQELNRLEQVKNARRLDKLPPGGNPRHVRGIPGLDVGHRIPDIDLPSNFRLENAATNRARPGIARRLGLSDLFR